MKKNTVLSKVYLGTLFILLAVTNAVSAQSGLLNYNFNTDAEGWYIDNYDTGATSEVNNGSFNVTYDLTQEEYNRANLIIDDLVVNPGTYPILAIKWENAPVRTFQVHCNLGTYKNNTSGSNYDGVVDGDVYYYDLRSSFGSSENYLSLTESTTLDYLQWKVTENLSENTLGYSVDWIRTFESVSALESSLATSIGKNANVSSLQVFSGKGNITIRGCEAKSRVTLYNMSGKVVSKHFVYENEIEMQCKAGVYIVEISGSTVDTKKAVVY